MYHGGGETSPRFQKDSVHGDTQHGEHSGPDTRSQPEGGTLQVSLDHVSVCQREEAKQSNSKTIVERMTSQSEYSTMTARTMEKKTACRTNKG